MRKNINGTKSVKDMFRPELVMYVYNNQSLIFNQESTKQDINSLNDNRIYEIAYQIEKKMQEV